MQILGLKWIGCTSLGLSVLLGADCGVLRAQSDPTDLTKPEGHSVHGEAFNEGPRQAALLLPGMGKVDLKCSTKSPLAAKFINQGLAQFHGFWFLESERSFRQAATIDPECAMAYWGMAIANKENDERARGFIRQAVQLQEHASSREQRYIKAWAKYLSVDQEKEKEVDSKEKGKSESKEKDSKQSLKEKQASKVKKDVRSESDKAKELVSDLEKLSLEFPEDLEAKAIICFRLWEGEHEGLRLTSRLSVDALIGEVLAVEPMHPAHHYRIHLWDGTKGQKALESAAKCGPSSPGIAHMWHMPGHTYSELKRYQDAVYQQEASARVDHAHMMRARLLPDQIHNFAHNNEWLIRNMLAIGRVEDSLQLSSNMISLPRHTKYNKPDGRGSSSFGRDRLIETITKYRLWDRALALENSILLDPEGSPSARIERFQLLACAAYAIGKKEKGANWLGILESELKEAELKIEKLEELPPSTPDRDPKSDQQKSLVESYKKKEDQRKKDLESEKGSMKKLKRAVAFAQGYAAAGEGKWEEALKKLDDAESRDHGLRAEWMLAAGKTEEAIKKADQFVQDHRSELLPLAIASYVHWTAGKKESAKEHFAKLRKLASTANLDTPLLARLLPMAKELDAGTSWAIPHEQPKDIGERPPLDLLGPFRWEPYSAEDWVLEDGQGNVGALKKYRGKPMILIFYLGAGCLHCVEQLQAFEKAASKFRAQGIELVAISSETAPMLRSSLEKYDRPISIPLHADPQQQIFRAYRCFDDFEQIPLHGTFAISGQGKVLWQDIGFEPFMDTEFVLNETKRQLRLSSELRQ